MYVATVGTEPAHFGPADAAPRNVSSVRGRSAALTCLALGDPPLSVHWTHDGRKLDLDSYRLTFLIFILLLLYS